MKSLINVHEGLQKESAPLLKEYFRTGPEEDSFFGVKIKSRTYKDNVMCEILNILMTENQIGEKDWSMTDEAVFVLEEWVNENMDSFQEVVSEHEKTNQRETLCAEVCYSKFFKENNLLQEQGGDLLNEAKKSEFEKLKENKIPLTDEERKQVMDADAVWHHGPNGAPSPAVWKSKDSKGKTIYVTHTHRAYNTARTLKAAINKYHRFIKGTA